VAELSKLAAELRQLQRELVEQQYVRRADGVERIEDALRRLGEVGSPAGILARAAEELGHATGLDPVLISRVEGERLVPLAELEPFALSYPLIEADVARNAEATLISVAASGRRAAPSLVLALGWERYAVAAIRLEGKTVGLIHAAAMDELDLALVAAYADGLGRVFERAVLREQLRLVRRQLQAAGTWINGQLAVAEQPSATPALPGDDRQLAELLTPRELEVLRLVARGLSNREIAVALTIGEGTVKYHVKNVLRKLQARSRAQAVSRYMRLRGERP
jgi:DNA-binding NarL/FixJ family response regulator